MVFLELKACSYLKRTWNHGGSVQWELEQHKTGSAEKATGDKKEKYSGFSLSPLAQSPASVSDQLSPV